MRSLCGGLFVLCLITPLTRFHLDIGTYEENFQQQDLLNGNRRLREFLEARGYGLHYRELHEGIVGEAGVRASRKHCGSSGAHRNRRTDVDGQRRSACE